MTSEDESSCFNKCAQNQLCIQYVFKAKSSSCFLKNIFNISNGIPSDDGTIVKSIKSSSNEYKHDAKSDQYNFTISYLTPYGDKFENNLKIKKG